MRRSFDVCALEYEEGGNTLWIHSPDGTTLFRIKAEGGITTQVCNTSPVPHGDLLVKESIVICSPKEFLK